MALSELLKKSGEEKENINYIVCGDLLDQCTASAFGIKESNIPYLGVYGACSTMAESLSVAAMLTDGGFSERLYALPEVIFVLQKNSFVFRFSMAVSVRQLLSGLLRELVRHL